MRKLVIFAAAFLVASCGTPDNDETLQADGDDAMMGDAQTMPGPNDMAMQGNVPTDTYVSRAAMSDMYEIQAGQLAINKGNSDMTREFGRMMVDDHAKSSRDMKAALAGANVSVTPPAALDAEHQQMLDRLEAASGDAFDREYVSQQMAAHRKALALHQGYAQNGESAELKSFAQKVVPVIQKHHDRLETSAMGNAATNATMTPGTNTGMSGDNQ